MNEEAKSTVAEYLRGRWQEQCDYFERKASANQWWFLFMRRLMLFASALTPIAIFGLLLVREGYNRDLASIVPLLLSSLAVGSYQWEELHNYGAQWAKFRLVAERLKGHKALYLAGAGPYVGLSPEDAATRFIEFCEGLIEGTDVNYFVLMVDPLRRNQDIR